MAESVFLKQTDCTEKLAMQNRLRVMLIGFKRRGEEKIDGESRPPLPLATGAGPASPPPGQIFSSFAFAATNSLIPAPGKATWILVCSPDPDTATTTPSPSFAFLTF